jgi:Fuc2NAc and GlcNAc transferase
MGVTDLRLAMVLAGGTLALSVVGWLDDRNGVSPRLRFLIHALVAAGAAYLLGGMSEIRIGRYILPLGFAGYLIAIVGIIWCINLFNFMDGIDGLAGSQAVLIFGTAAGLFMYRGEVPLAVVSAIFAAAAAGFLFHNWPPARIFLGDVGSGPVGFLIGAVALASERKQSVPLLVFAIVGGVFIVDATVTLIRRVLRGRRMSEAHRDHAYQRLSRAWGSHRSVSIAAALVTTLLSLLGLLATMRPSFAGIALIVAALILGGAMIAVERRAPM